MSSWQHLRKKCQHVISAGGSPRLIASTAYVAVCGESEQIPFGIEDLASRMDLTIHRISNPFNRPWSCGVRINGDNHEIWLNKDLPTENARFNLAHCIGHLLLSPDNTELSCTFNAPHESAPNVFAVNLLVPMHVLESVTWPWTSTEKLARAFGVTKKLIEMQLIDLYTYGTGVKW